MYINKIDALNVPFTFQTAHATAEEKALLDSGATENFLDEETWRRMGVGRRVLDKPLKVINVDGTENRKGTITHYCRLRIIYNGESDLQDFYIASLGRDQMILGYPFFRRFEPKVSWKRGTLQDGSITIQSAVFKHLDKIIEHYQLQARKAVGELEEGEEIYMSWARKTTMAQQMAKYFRQTNDQEENPIPERFQ